MTERDNTNRGVIFAPAPNDTSLVGTGKINVDGDEQRYVLLRHPVQKDGDPQLVVYMRVGVLWDNSGKPDRHEKAPKYSGDFLGDKRLSGWPGKSESGVNYISLAVEEKRQRDGAPAKQEEKPGFTYDDPNDIPF